MILLKYIWIILQTLLYYNYDYLAWDMLTYDGYRFTLRGSILVGWDSVLIGQVMVLLQVVKQWWPLVAGGIHIK